MYSFPPLATAIDALHTVIDALITFLTPILGSASPAASIVLLTVAVRLLLLPLSRRQVRANIVRERLAPQLRELQRRHKNNPDRLRRETAALYAKEGASPLAGCLPMLMQIPVFAAVFGLFMTNDVSNASGGVPLGTHLVGATGSGLVMFGVIIAVLLAVGWLTRRSMPESDAPGASLIRLLPFGSAISALVLPMAAGIYLATTTTWTFAERTALRKIISRADSP